MQYFDVVIVGAGPAGGEAARGLSKAGFHILLLEKESSFAANDFSSGGAPLEILNDFKLPSEVVGAFCHQIKIATSHDDHLWQAQENIAVVLDFKKLRSFLAEQTTKNGSTVRLGTTYHSHETQDKQTHVHFKNNTTEKIETIETRVLIDATGSERRVLMGPQKNKPGNRKVIVGRGIEYLLEVPETVYQSHASCLSFYIGTKWMPQGYAWIFPMQDRRLKVGVGRNYPDEQIVPHEKAMGHYLDQLIRECLKTEDIHVLDKHGKTIVYTCHQQDQYRDQNVIAIGDAVSTVNPLTFEGIRHALKSGQIAAAHVRNFLERGQSLDQYPSEMRRYCGMKWTTSEILTEKIYREPDDDKMTMMLSALKGLSLNALKDLVFYYTFKSAVQFYAVYQFLVIKRALGLGKKTATVRTKK